MDLKLPPLGEGADSGSVVNLFVKEGDTITKGQPVLELENEKAVAAIPSTGAGTIGRIYVKIGDKISVGQRILALKEEPGGLIQTPSPEPAAAVIEVPVASQGGEAFQARPEAAPAAAPSLRKLARDLGIDLTRVHGSARGGRIVLEDLRAYVQRLQRLAQPGAASPASTAAAEPRPPAAQIDFSRWGPVSRKPLSALRQVIARRMLENWNGIPHVTQFDEADITAMEALRKKYGPVYEQNGARLTITSFALKVVVDTLKKHPAFNSSLDEASQELVFKEYYHIGIAVDTEAGLIVPVLRDTDKKSMLVLCKELEEAARKARERKISAEDLKGGTFTITNQGGIGGGHFTPIVNKPEVAILGLGRGALRAGVRENTVQPRLMLPIALSYDHRVIDGGMAARFVVDLVRAFENFDEKELVPHSSSSSSSSSK